MLASGEQSKMGLGGKMYFTSTDDVPFPGLWGLSILLVMPHNIYTFILLTKLHDSFEFLKNI